MLQIDLCKDLPIDQQEKCEIMEIDLDDATQCLLNQLAEKTGMTTEALLEKALLDFLESVQTDYVAEL